MPPNDSHAERALEAIRDGDRRPSKRPRLIHGLIAEKHEYPIPHSIIRMMQDGWEHYLPLTLLTNRMLTAMSNGTIPEPNFSKDGKADTMASGEGQMTFEDWLMAWKRLLKLVQSYLPGEHEGWKVHFDRICGNDSRQQDWILYLRYDIHIRTRRHIQGLDPAVFQKNIFDNLSQEYHAELAREAGKALAAPAARSSSGSFRDSYGNPDFAQSSNRGTSYNRRPNKKFEGANGARCFVCNRTSHSSKNCYHSTFPDGKPTFLHPSPDRTAWFDSAGKAYCWFFNLRGCRDAARGRTSCTKGLHACTLCGAAGADSHGAQYCPA
ncbi:hypothetical protein SISNIDRAFT_409442 [Sistotremastrum niveocremeum HHB9708]|uniref:Uncharacterized protein n=1 Tax=Sistotremastrum niveocremeum HHB9708 TaxID=1314777 RepID=A0A164WES4_9AGAM|nr:hypothetical protein SISNIDRAFT_409442 [Sistotremastrum niveocremeum HHB9708]